MIDCITETQLTDTEFTIFPREVEQCDNKPLLWPWYPAGHVCCWSRSSNTVSAMWRLWSRERITAGLNSQYWIECYVMQCKGNIFSGLSSSSRRWNQSNWTSGHLILIIYLIYLRMRNIFTSLLIWRKHKN